MKTLHLTLKKKWFDMIASGEKTEEYRELKDYWAQRLFNRIEHPRSGYFSPYPDFWSKDYEFNGWNNFTGGAPVFIEFDAVIFRNGYSGGAPLMSFRNPTISIDTGIPEWGAEPGKKYFVIKLGERV